MKNKLVLLLFAVVLAGCASQTVNTNKAVAITVYKSQSCGCCGGYISALEGAGYDVTTKVLPDVSPIKTEHNIPQDVWSCHTSIVGKYFVEGHVPLEAVAKLVREQPDIDGIALPGMPAGSPGMSGIKSAPFVVLALKNGQETEFMKV